MIARSLVALAFATLSVLPNAWASVLAIDYGTDWTKASLMKPGVPFDVLLNKDSKRKIHSSVGWNRGDRLFSTDAFNIATRFPTDSFPSLKHILGQQFTSNTTWYYSQVGQAVLMDTDRGTVEIARKGGGAPWSVEELIAMQLAYIRGLAEDVAAEPVTDVVLTVPAFFSHVQRQAVLDAIEISGMKTLALLNDGSAVAVNYAMTRSFPEKEHHIIFDAGAGSIRATVASFHSPDAKPAGEEKKKKASKLKTPTKESATVEILGFGYDTVASGNELTRRLRDRFIQQFETKHKSSLERDGRARARLWKEAERVKGILSANADSRSTVESLSNDIDFKTTTSRAEFETLSEDLKTRYAAPIADALESSGLTWANITSIILMGGHSRVPMVQNAVRELAGETSISQNVNTDEAAVLGAAFYAASLSPQFRTKKIKLQDVGVHDIQISYEAEGKSGKRTITNKIFPKLSSKVGAKKTLTFKRKEDFDITFSYPTANTPEFPSQIMQVSIQDVAAAVANLTSRGATEPVVKVTVQLNENGHVAVTEAVAYGEVKDDTLTGKLKNLFGGGAAPESAEAPDASESASASVTSSTAAPSGTPVSDAEAKKVQKNTVPLTVQVTPLASRPMSSEEKLNARSRLVELDLAEKAQEERAEAVNLLEGYIYRVRDLLSEAEASETEFKEFSTDDERHNFKTLLEETAEWLHEIDADVTTAILQAKKAALEAHEMPIQGRHREFKAIPEAIKDLNKALDNSRAFYQAALKEIIPPPAEKREASDEEDVEASAESPIARFTSEELDEIRDVIADTEKWLKEKIEQVGGTKKNVDAPFRAAEIDQQGIKLQRKVVALEKRPKPKPAKKKTKSSTSASSSSTTASATESETASPTSTTTASDATGTVRDEL
ncbi:HSP70-domain-containing protein [Clavulina sp. PMI_390]|nr:HSP70-domain-containing protein [Clavulina sp. PMI_390]